MANQEKSFAGDLQGLFEQADVPIDNAHILVGPGEIGDDKLYWFPVIIGGSHPEATAHPRRAVAIARILAASRMAEEGAIVFDLTDVSDGIRAEVSSPALAAINCVLETRLLEEAA